VGVAARPREGSLGDHTNSRVTFQRAIERGNLVVAEVTARELGRLDLADALDLTALISLHDRDRGRRAAMRWLRWWLEARSPTLDEAAIVVALLAALGGAAHAKALSTLRGMAEPETSRSAGRRMT
jgi:hypothetical protein